MESPIFRYACSRALFGFLLALPFLALSQEEAGRIRFTTLSKSNSEGLKSDMIRNLTQDLGGFVWLATDRGLSRFDGWETAHYFHDPGSPASLSSNQLTSVATTQETKTKGPLWIGTSSSGLMKFDQGSDQVTRFVKGGTRSGNLLSNNIVALAVSEDKFLWIGTDAGLNVLNLATGNIVVAEGELGKTRISSISSFNKNEVWVGTAAGDLYEWNAREKAFTRVWSTTVPVNAVARDARNGIWIGTGGLGLYTYNTDHSDEPKRHPINGNNITSLFVDSNADLWVGTMNGLALYDRGNESFIYFTNNPRHSDSLTDDQISAIFEDRSRMLWVATYGGGTSRFNLDRQWFSHIRYTPGKQDGLPHSAVRTLSTVTDGNLWIGTNEGAAKWSPETGSFAPITDPGADTDAAIQRILLDRKGNLWFGTRGKGLLRTSPDGTTTRFVHDAEDRNSLGHNNVSFLFEDSKERIFVGTQGAGLLLFDPAKETFTRLESDSESPEDFITSLSEDAGGNLWVSDQSEIRILPNDSLRLVEMRNVFPNSERPTSSRTNTILPDSNGIIWIGSKDAGLDRFNTNTGEVSNFSSAVNGLPDDEVVALIKDDNNFLWVATRSGIARLNAMQSEFRVFNEEDGLQREGFQVGAVAKDKRGRLYFGGMDGFNVIDPANLPALPRTPHPILTSFEYFGEPVVPRKGGILENEIAATDEIRLPFDQRIRFALCFANFDYRFPNRGHFRYMLKGYDDWQLARDDRKASYSNLPPGKYQFVVQSSLDGRDWPDVTAKVRIVITPPWWQTWWFRALSLTMLVLGTVTITRFTIRSRVRQMQRREEMLTAQRDKAEAALARELQNRMLLERTTKDLKNEVREDQILSAALQHISVQFSATHCLVQRIVSENETDDSEEKSGPCLKQIGYYSTMIPGPGNSPPALALEDPFVRMIFNSPSVISVSDPRQIPATIRQAFAPGEAITLLAARTSFLDATNGLILMLRVGASGSWTEDDVKLLEALTGQFGISIAQINTSVIEEKYHTHLEEARHHAEVANRAKSDFLAKMTHELRTPLNAIIGFSEILGEDKSLNPKQRETLDIINNSGEHLLDVINEILDLSKIEAGKMEKNDEIFDLVPLLKTVYEMLSIKAEAKRIGFNFAARSGLPGEIVSDRSKLRQILINLIGNAIKFTAQGAVGVTITSHELSKPVLFEGRLRRRVRLDFEIRDTGRGIHEEEIGRLFERYSQTESGRRSSEGTGLGLPIARSFVQLLGGDVAVESVFGEGTTFRFSIECEELAPAVASDLQLGTTLDEKTVQRINGIISPLGEIRILIVEDQPTNRLLLKRILSKAGFVLSEAENGQAAIEKWSECKPHLILMDEDMPVMKGSEATREIKALAGPDNNPIIVSLTAYALEQARLSALEAGCADFVAKPFRSHELFSVISKHLGIDYTFTDAA